MTGARRWLGYLALVIVFAVVCGLLSWWQFARNEEAGERIRQIEENWDAAPRPLGDVLATPGSAFDPGATWTPVELEGAYLAEETLLVRNRPRDGRPGFEVLVPFRLDDGGILVVDRGWLPAGERQAERPDAVPAPPSGPQTIIVRLRAGEPAVPGRSAPAGQVATIELPRIAELLGDEVYTGAFGMLAAEPGAEPGADAPLTAARPAADPGPHLSYAVQWILFALMAALALVWGVWNERRVQRLSAEEREALRAAAVLRRARRDVDATAEDALLDA